MTVAKFPQSSRKPPTNMEQKARGKIKRITAGCDFCRGRHLRCSGQPAPCVECARRNRTAEDCVFPVGPLRKRGPPKGRPLKKRDAQNSSSEEQFNTPSSSVGTGSASPELQAADYVNAAHELALFRGKRTILPRQPQISLHPEASELPPRDIADELLRLALNGRAMAMAPILHRASFQPRGPYRPPWLCWSLMALASRFVPEIDHAPGAPPEGWGARLFNLATASLNSVLGTLPSLPTVQALIFLIFVASIEPSFDSSVTTMLPLALNMVRALGLNRTGARALIFSQNVLDERRDSATSFVSSTSGPRAQSIISATDDPAFNSWILDEEGRRSFWILFGLDRMLAAINGSDLLLSEAEGIPTESYLSDEVFLDTNGSGLVGLDSLSSQSRLLPRAARAPSMGAPQDDLAEVPTRHLLLDMLTHRASSLSKILAEMKLPEFGPGSEVATSLRKGIRDALDRWADAQEHYGGPSQTAALLSNLSASLPPKSAFSCPTNLWLRFHLANVYLTSTRHAIVQIFKSVAPSQVLPQVAQWLQEAALVEECLEHIRYVAGWLAEILQVGGTGPDRDLGILGYIGVPVAYCCMVWLLSGKAQQGGAVSSAGNNGYPFVVINRGTTLGRFSGPRVRDEDVFLVMTTVLREMSKVWRVCGMYAEGLNEVAGTLGGFGSAGEPAQAAASGPA